MKTKREALAEVGLAIAGARGKFSKVANEQLDKWRAEGIKFSDDDKPVKPTGPKPEPVAKTVVPGDSDYTLISDYRFPLDEYRAFIREAGKKVYLPSLKECCDCGYSFCNHPCDSPTKYGKVVVIEKVR